MYLVNIPSELHNISCEGIDAVAEGFFVHYHITGNVAVLTHILHHSLQEFFLLVVEFVIANEGAKLIARHLPIHLYQRADKRTHIITVGHSQSQVRILILASQLLPQNALQLIHIPLRQLFKVVNFLQHGQVLVCRKIIQHALAVSHFGHHAYRFALFGNHILNVDDKPAASSFQELHQVTKFFTHLFQPLQVHIFPRRHAHHLFNQRQLCLHLRQGTFIVVKHFGNVLHLRHLLIRLHFGAKQRQLNGQQQGIKHLRTCLHRILGEQGRNVMLQLLHIFIRERHPRLIFLKATHRLPLLTHRDMTVRKRHHLLLQHLLQLIMIRLSKSVCLTVGMLQIKCQLRTQAKYLFRQRHRCRSKLPVGILLKIFKVATPVEDVEVLLVLPLTKDVGRKACATTFHLHELNLRLYGFEEYEVQHIGHINPRVQHIYRHSYLRIAVPHFKLID